MSLRRELALLACATQFLTRLPVPVASDFQPDWIGRSSRYFPLVGQLVGLLSAAAAVGAALAWPASIAALLAVAAGVAVTGAFHEDGLADTADGLGGGSTVARRLEIMKDSRLGTYGVLALGLALALKVGALTLLTERSHWMAGAALVAAHGAGRAAAVVAMRFTPYVGDRDAAKVKPVPEAVRGSEVTIAIALALWPLLLLQPRPVLQGLGLGAIGSLAVGLQAKRLLGGHTGDVLGAVEQAFEIGFLLGASAWLPA